MILNDDGFPNFLEVSEKFNLHDKQNKDLCEYFKVMYDKYYSLYQQVYNMSSEQIRVLKELKSLLFSNYYKELGDGSLSVQNDMKMLDLFKKEPDAQAAAQKLYDIYMSKCADSFKRDIQLLFNDYEYE